MARHGRPQGARAPLQRRAAARHFLHGRRWGMHASGPSLTKGPSGRPGCTPAPFHHPLQVLEAGGSALDAVVASVVALEDDPRFNAGGRAGRGGAGRGRGRASQRPASRFLQELRCSNCCCAVQLQAHCAGAGTYCRIKPSLLAALSTACSRPAAGRGSVLTQKVRRPGPRPSRPSCPSHHPHAARSARLCLPLRAGATQPRRARVVRTHPPTRGFRRRMPPTRRLNALHAPGRAPSTRRAPLGAPRAATSWRHRS
jgi:hypothetical protein